jgi:hypothetical protein
MAHEGFRNLSYTNKRSVAKKQVMCVQAKYLTILISCITQTSFNCITDIMAKGGMIANSDWQESGNCHDMLYGATNGHWVNTCVLLVN